MKGYDCQAAKDGEYRPNAGSAFVSVIKSKMSDENRCDAESKDDGWYERPMNPFAVPHGDSANDDRCTDEQCVHQRTVEKAKARRR